MEDIPALLCGESALRNPSNVEIAKYLGVNSEIDESRLYDLIVIGAGPSGLAAALYAASEGLDVLVLESRPNCPQLVKVSLSWHITAGTLVRDLIKQQVRRHPLSR